VVLGLKASQEAVSFDRFEPKLAQEVDLKVAALGPAKRSQRYAAVIEDGVIKVCLHKQALHSRTHPGFLSISPT
jgi:peroxiredoxin